MATIAPSLLTCPSEAELRLLVRGRLKDSDQIRISDHLGICINCQNAVELIATDGDVEFSRICRTVKQAPPPEASAYWNAISRAEIEIAKTIGTHDLDTPFDTELNLDFLKPTTTPNRIGRIGNFDVLRVLGRGGMGVVLHAFDDSLHRDVAVKVLDPQLANNKIARQRFCREARAAASVSHDNLVAIYQVNEDEKAGLPYLVMQLINGETLEDRLRRVGKLSVAEAVRVGMQAAAGLASAHAIKLIHRDIKPANILLDQADDKVKLTDFGLARAVEDMKLTRTGFVAGTPLYMAPEQARGDEIDLRSDLFSLGSVMYESLAGNPPFNGKTPLVVLRKLTDDPHPPLRDLNPEVPDWLEDIIDRLLAKNPDDRIQTAKELSELLASHYQCLNPASGTHHLVDDNCMRKRFVSYFRLRRRGVAARVLAFGLPLSIGLFAGGVGGYTLAPRVNNSTDRAQDLMASLTNFKKSGVSVGPNERQTLPGRTGAVWTVASTKDAKTIAVGQEDGVVTIWDAEKGAVKNVIDAHKGPVWIVEYFNDDKQIVTASDDGTVKIWNIDNLKEPIRTLENKGSVRSAAVAPKGDKIVTGDRMGHVIIWDLMSGTKINELSLPGVINAVAFSPDGESIAVASTDRNAYIYNVGDNALRVKLTGHTGPIYSLAFSPSGEYLATASWDHTLRLWGTKFTAKEMAVVEAHDEGIWGISFSCCGAMLATAGQDGLVKLWKIDYDDTKTTVNLQKTFDRHKGTVHTVRFTKDNKSLLTGGRDGTVRIWDIAGSN